MDVPPFLLSALRLQLTQAARLKAEAAQLEEDAQLLLKHALGIDPFTEHWTLDIERGVVTKDATDGPDHP